MRTLRETTAADRGMFIDLVQRQFQFWSRKDSAKSIVDRLAYGTLITVLVAPIVAYCGHSMVIVPLHTG